MVEAKIGAAGVGTIPVRLPHAEAAIIGGSLDPAEVEMAAEVARAEVDPSGDIHGSADYRRDLVRALIRRALL